MDMNHRGAAGINPRRNRNSILQTAGDALGFRLNKRKRVSTISSHAHSPSSYSESHGHNKLSPSVFDDVVLEISATANGFHSIPAPIAEYAEDDEAAAERERLRDAAAQAVGLPQANNAFYATSVAGITNGPSPHYAPAGDAYVDSGPAPARQTQSGKTRGVIKVANAGTTGSGLPRYPGTLASMQAHVQNATSLLKYYSSTSPFHILSRSRQWKTRYIALTSTVPYGSRRAESHLHIFKAGAPDDRELERMRVHDKTVVYVADEEVGGGRQFVLKIGGVAVDAGSKEIGPTTWLVQMPDSAQMQIWIQVVKNAVLLQKAERDGPGTEVYHNMYGNTRQERKSDTDMSAKHSRQSFAPGPLPIASTLDSLEHNSNSNFNGSSTPQQPNGATTGLGPVSALKGLWNNRPTSRQLSVSGSSITTAFATPSLSSQASAQATVTSTVQAPLPSPLPASISSDADPPTHQETTPTGGPTPSRSRESNLYNLFRPTSPPQASSHHHQQQASITQVHMSPPISPTASLPFTDETATAVTTAVTSPSSTLGTSSRFSPTGSGRHGHHSSSFSVDWDAIDPAALAAKRVNPVMQQTALAPPPPRRRPLTGGGLPQRQPSPPKEVVEEEREQSLQRQQQQRQQTGMSPSPALGSLPLEDIPIQSFDDGEDEVDMETALRGQGGQRSYFDDDDEEEMDENEHDHEHNHDNDNSMIQEVSMDHLRAPADLSPLSGHSHGHNDEEEESQRSIASASAHLPSPLQRSNLPLSSASSFGANGGSSIKTAIHEQSSQSQGMSLHSESRDDLITEDHREGAELEGGDSVNQFHLPTGARRRSRLSSIPRQLSPPLGPPPPVPMPMFSSPPFPALSSPAHDYSGSERPGSSSSIPSSLYTTGLPPLLSKRISTMSSDAPSIKSTESSGGGSMNNSKILGGREYVAGSSRLSAIPGPLGPRSSAFPPPRPAPSTALPPAPAPAPPDDLTSMGGHHRLSFSNKISPLGRNSGSGSASSRSEFISRAARYSIGPAGPPPTAALPPTPLTMGEDASAAGYSPALPRTSMSSFSSNGGSGIGNISSLFTIPASPATGKPPPNSNLPAMAPLPIRPLPPTPNRTSAPNPEDRPVSPSALSTTSNRSTRSTSAIPFSRMSSSLKLRLRMMSSPTPIVSIPPAQPPPTFPPPDIPQSLQKQPQPTFGGFSDVSGLDEYVHPHAHLHSFSPSPPITPLGEAITSRLDFPFGMGAGATAAQTASYSNANMNGIPSTSSSSANSPAVTMSFASRAMRTVMQPSTSAAPTDMTPLSPPPRRNSRASRDLTPLEKERWKMVVAGLEEESSKTPATASSAGQGPPGPYEGVPAKHSAINLPSFVD